MARWRRLRWWGLIVGVVVVVGVWLGTAMRRRAPVVDVAEVVRKDLRQVVAASGKIRPWTEVEVSSRTNGTVWRVAVQEGDRVHKGQLLLEIDPVPLRTQLERLEATLERVRHQLESAQLMVEQAERRFRRVRQLFREGLVTRETLEQVQTDLEVRRREYAAAQQRVRELEAQIEGIRHDYEQVRITAPMDGWVIGVYVEEGETVVVRLAGIGTEKPLVKIADLTRWKVELEVDETDIVQVRPGQQVRITIDALPEREFWGIVTLVGYEPLQAANRQLGQAGRENLFPVEVELRETLPEVRPGFTVHAEIVTAEVRKALSIPIQALVYRSPHGSDQEVAGVLILEGERVRFRPIKVGIMGEFDLEVRAGLREGERVVTGPYQVLERLNDGDRVRVRTED